MHLIWTIGLFTRRTPFLARCNKCGIELRMSNRSIQALKTHLNVHPEDKAMFESRLPPAIQQQNEHSENPPQDMAQSMPNILQMLDALIAERNELAEHICTLLAQTSDSANFIAVVLPKSEHLRQLMQQHHFPLYFEADQWVYRISGHSQQTHQNNAILSGTQNPSAEWNCPSQNGNVTIGTCSYSIAPQLQDLDEWMNEHIWS